MFQPPPRITNNKYFCLASDNSNKTGGEKPDDSRCSEPPRSPLFLSDDRFYCSTESWIDRRKWDLWHLACEAFCLRIAGWPVRILSGYIERAYSSSYVISIHHLSPRFYSLGETPHERQTTSFSPTAPSCKYSNTSPKVPNGLPSVHISLPCIVVWLRRNLIICRARVWRNHVT